jgi:hypothetical protein
MCESSHLRIFTFGCTIATEHSAVRPIPQTPRQNTVHFIAKRDGGRLGRHSTNGMTGTRLTLKLSITTEEISIRIAGWKTVCPTVAAVPRHTMTFQAVRAAPLAFPGESWVAGHRVASYYANSVINNANCVKGKVPASPILNRVARPNSMKCIYSSSSISFAHRPMCRQMPWLRSNPPLE